MDGWGVCLYVISLSCQCWFMWGGKHKWWISSLECNYHLSVGTEEGLGGKHGWMRGTLLCNNSISPTSWAHNILKQCVFILWALRTYNHRMLGAQSWYESPCTRFVHPIVTFSRATWTNAHSLITSCLQFSSQKSKHVAFHPLIFCPPCRLHSFVYIFP